MPKKFTQQEREKAARQLIARQNEPVRTDCRWATVDDLVGAVSLEWAWVRPLEVMNLQCELNEALEELKEYVRGCRCAGTGKYTYNREVFEAFVEGGEVDAAALIDCAECSTARAILAGKEGA